MPPIRLAMICVVTSVLWTTACQRQTDPAGFQTRAERTNYVETGTYAEMVSFCAALERASPWVRVTSIGETGEGRAMPLVIVSREQAFDPARAAATGKAVVLIQNGIHSGEIEGKDASLQLLREIVVTRERVALLDHVLLLVLPIFNIDGHERISPYNRINQNGPREMGWRCNATNLNLNRDFMLAQSPEMRAFLGMYHAWKPHFWFDTHTTDGADFQYDVTFVAATAPEMPEPVSDWVCRRLHPHLMATLSADGHCPQRFFDMRDRLDPAKGLDASIAGFGPRFSTGYGAITHRPSLLVETHMLKPYSTRVRATHCLLVRTLELINRDHRALVDGVKQCDEAAARLSQGEANARIILTTSRPADDPGESVVFRGYEHEMIASEASGGQHPVWHRDRPRDMPSRLYTASKPDKTVTPPWGYIVPPQWTEVIERLRLHGLTINRLREAAEIEVESYRFEDVAWKSRPFEGRQELSYRVVPVRECRRFPAGSVVVRMDQPMCKAAAFLLEPESPEALVRWGFFNPIFEQKEYFEDYAMAPIADRMLREDPALRQAFMTWQAANPDVRDDSRARLMFFYRRSPYWDDRKDMYPVGRLVRSLPVGMLTKS